MQSSQHHPVILEIENLHWIDATSAEWLTAFVEHLGGIPVLLVLTYRPGYRPPWIEKSYATQLALPYLAAADSRRMLHALLQERLPGATVLEQLVAKAGGNPLFLEELARGVQEQSEGAGSLDLPATINVVLNARLQRLTGEARTVLQHAAVIGETVPLPMLAAVVGDAAGDLQPVLETLQAAEFLHVTHFDPEPVFRFKHVLTHEVVYQSVRDATRRRLPYRVADTLETRYREHVATQPERLAAHYTAAGEVARALPYWLQAGQQAIARAANVEAIRHLTQGLTLLATLPETPARLQQELTFSVTLGAPLIMTRGYAAPEVENAYSRARALYRQVGDTPQSFPALYGIALFYLVRGECQTAQQLMYQALRMAQQSQGPALLLLAHTLLGVTSFFRGEFVTAQEHLEQAIARYDPAQHHALAFRYGDDPGTLSLSYLHLVLCLQGYLDQARERSKQAVALARQLGHSFSLANPLITAAVLCQFCHEDMATYAWAEEIITLSTQQGFAHWLGGGMIFQGWSLVQV